MCKTAGSRNPCNKTQPQLQGLWQSNKGNKGNHVQPNPNLSCGQNHTRVRSIENKQRHSYKGATTTTTTTTKKKKKTSSVFGACEKCVVPSQLSAFFSPHSYKRLLFSPSSLASSLSDNHKDNAGHIPRAPQQWMPLLPHHILRPCHHLQYVQTKEGDALSQAAKKARCEMNMRNSTGDCMLLLMFFFFFFFWGGGEWFAGFSPPPPSPPSPHPPPPHLLSKHNFRPCGWHCRSAAAVSHGDCG